MVANYCLGMTRAPTSSQFPESANAQIDVAVLRLVDLIARQVALELAADAPKAKEPSHATNPPQQD